MSSVASAQQPVSVLLVDDEPRLRQGIRTLLGFYSANSPFTFEVVGEAADASQAIKLVAEQHPGLIVLDLELLTEDGITVLHHLREMAYRGKVLVLSAHREDEWVFRAMQAGASGYVFKDNLATQLCTALNTVLNDQVYLSPEVATCFFRLFHFYAGRSLAICQKFDLTEREQQVLNWLIQGASNEAIAEHLYITVATVKAHLTSIFNKLSVTSRTQAIIKALKLGLVNS
ncbi:DNA-binding response regulator [Leptolyngbya sp. 'hensonii']|uniref:response regulator n=1 Tax=Leptolyngbya sp. 'hensonii' TaxID=1922337 RepID=UPI00094FAD36|nr:response regulator transcription factor [Leptolyngbya sp. 'hensonii']OLP16742.1 DNA-binding response regulator [Leptolyngbya sp. 'hensonii']